MFETSHTCGQAQQPQFVCKGSQVFLTCDYGRPTPVPLKPNKIWLYLNKNNNMWPNSFILSAIFKGWSGGL